jgi:putative PIN family toxin of toxin-antitoxin system
LFSKREIQLCISDELFEEYIAVLNREKFSKFPEFMALAQILLAEIERIAIKYYPEVKLEIIRDLDDNKLLELAETCEADFLITGNSSDFTMREYKSTKIITPKEYWENNFT